MGNLDISLAGKSNPAINRGSKISLGGSTITASGTGYSITFKPYYELDYAFATMNGSTAGQFTVADIDYNGLMTARVISDLGEFVAYYPAVDTVDWDSDARDKNKISIGSNDVLYSVNKGGFAAISSYLKLGVDATVSGCNGDFCFVGSTLPGVSTTSLQSRVDLPWPVFVALTRKLNRYKSLTTIWFNLAFNRATPMTCHVPVTWLRE